MYTPKEKNKHFRNLFATVHANSDLELLKQKSPTHGNIDTFSRAPQRYAEEILYALLDHAAAEEVRENRREIAIEDAADTDVDADVDATDTNVDVDVGATDTDTDADADAPADADAAEEAVVDVDVVDTIVDTIADTPDDQPTPVTEPVEEPTKPTVGKKKAPSKKKTSTPTSAGATSKTKTLK